MKRITRKSQRPRVGILIAALALVVAAIGVGTGTAAATPRGYVHAPNITVPGIDNTILPQGLIPTPITVTKNGPGTAPGKIFTAPKGGVDPDQQGPEIINNAGQPYYFQPIDRPYTASDFRVQRYRGRPVLTFNVGQSTGGPGHSTGVDVILNDHYQQIATVSSGNGVADADQHEFRLTDYGTALITSYNPVHRDLSAYGGSANGLVYDGVAQEIDVATGKVVWEWHSLDHVPLSDSYGTAPANPATPWDYFHINAVNPDADGNILVDGRATSTVYKVSHDKTGNVIWQLGGKSSTFQEGPGVAFIGQHDPLPELGKRDTYRIFDNGILPGGPASGGPARAIVVKLDLKSKTAKLVSANPDPTGLPAYAEGNTQRLPTGGLFVGWGLALVNGAQWFGHLSEFNAAGNEVWDGNVPLGYDTYRDYRDPWVGKPLTDPTVVAKRTDASHVDVSTIWNGATEVRHWAILSGSSRRNLHAVAVVDWAGLKTKANIHTGDSYVEAVALDDKGHTIGHSSLVPVS